MHIYFPVHRFVGEGKKKSFHQFGSSCRESCVLQVPEINVCNNVPSSAVYIESLSEEHLEDKDTIEDVDYDSRPR